MRKRGINQGQGMGIESCLDRKTGKTTLTYQKAFNGKLNRFVGGTIANYYSIYGDGRGEVSQRKGDDPQYQDADRGLWKYLYEEYGYTGKCNIIFPFCWAITGGKNPNIKAEGLIVFNLLSHYRNITGYNPRTELINNIGLIDSISNMTDVANSPLSSMFKEIVNSNISQVTTFQKAGIGVDYIELGNELYMKLTDMDNFKSNNVGLDQVVWSRHSKYFEESMVIYTKLCAMYIRIVRSILPNVKFGVPATPLKKGGGFESWNQYLIRPNTAIAGRINGYVIHYYTDVPNTNITAKNITSNLDLEFNLIAERMYEHMYKYTRTDIYNTVNQLPTNITIWHTEWSPACPSNSIPNVSIQDKAGNTLLHLMANLSFQLECEIINSVKETIEMNIYHAGCNKLDGYYMYVRMNQWQNTTWIDPIVTKNTNANNIRFNAPYHADLLFDPIANGATFKNITTGNGYDIVSFIKDGYKYDYFVNRTRDSISLPANGDLIYYTANKLSASFGTTTFRTIDMNMFNDILTLNSDLTVQRVINVVSDKAPGLSVGYCKTKV